MPDGTNGVPFGTLLAGRRIGAAQLVLVALLLLDLGDDEAWLFLAIAAAVAAASAFISDRHVTPNATMIGPRP